MPATTARPHKKHTAPQLLTFCDRPTLSDLFFLFSCSCPNSQRQQRRSSILTITTTARNRQQDGYVFNVNVHLESSCASEGLRKINPPGPGKWERCDRRLDKKTRTASTPARLPSAVPIISLSLSAFPLPAGFIFSQSFAQVGKGRKKSVSISKKRDISYLISWMADLFSSNPDRACLNKKS